MDKRTWYRGYRWGLFTGFIVTLVGCITAVFATDGGIVFPLMMVLQ